MGRIKQSEIPAGDLREFFSELHALHLKAGQPSVRSMQLRIGRSVISHTTIYKALVGPRLPTWGVIELIVETLAESSNQNIESTIERFRTQWTNAVRSEAAAEHPNNQEKKSLGSALPLSQLLPKTLDAIEEAGLRKVADYAIPTGFRELDALTGGLKYGSLTVIASGSSIGKTTIILGLCRVNAIKHAIPSALLSLEMTEKELQMRLLSAEARVGFYPLRNGFMQDDEWTRLASCMSKIAQTPIRMLYSPDLSLRSLQGEAKTLAQKYGVKLIALDSIQSLITATAKDRPGCNANDVLLGLRQMAAELDISIVTSARMKSKDGTRDYGRPIISEMLDAEAIEHEADIIVLLYRPDVYDRESPRAGEIDLIVAKNRHGPTATVTAVFQGHYCRVIDFG